MAPKRISALLILCLFFIQVKAQVDENPFKAGRHIKKEKPRKVELSDGYKFSYYNQPVFSGMLRGTVFVPPSSIKEPLPPATGLPNELLDTAKRPVPNLAFYIRTDYVTNAEYRAYETYLLDSLTRRVLVEEGFSDLYSFFYFGRNDDAEGPWLNWKRKVDKNAPDILEPLHLTFIPPRERPYPFHRFYPYMKIPDKRKLAFEWYYFGPEVAPVHRVGWWVKRKLVSAVPDTLVWLRGERLAQDHIHYHYFDMDNSGTKHLQMGPFNKRWWNVKDSGELEQDNHLIGLGKYYTFHPYFREHEFVAFDRLRVEGFLAWKSKFHQKYLDRKGIPLKVVYKLPNAEEWQRAQSVLRQADSLLTVPSCNYDFARITVAEYQEFMHWVRDSVAHFQMKEAGFEEFVKKDPLDWGTDIVNHKQVINWEKPDSSQAKVLDAITQHPEDLCVFSWSELDYRHAAEIPYIGLIDRSSLIHKKETPVWPDTLAPNTDPLRIGDDKDHQAMPGITYHQARAYYFWSQFHKKRNIPRKALPEYWIIPSEVDWLMAQKGERWEKQFTVPYPQNRFRYIIRFYPQNDAHLIQPLVE